MRLWHSNRGDTIVEVLLAISILSLILSASYTIANRSSQALRQSVEHSEAHEIAKTQLEALKSYLAQNGSALPSANSTPFCMKYDPADTSHAGLQTVTDPSFQATAYDTYPASCQLNGSDSNDSRYKVVILRPDTNTFIATVHWDRAGGNGVDQAEMYYRLYPGSITDNVGTPVTLPGCAANKYDPTGLGTCRDCAPGYRSLPGSIGIAACTPIPPSIKFVVNSVDVCGSIAGSQARYGATVTPTGNDISGNPLTAQDTGTDSSITYSELAFGATYSATFTAPPGTNPSSETAPTNPAVGTTYTTYAPSGGDSFTACTPSTTSVTTPGPSPNGRDTTTTDTTLTFQHNCQVKTIWTYSKDADPDSYYGDDYIDHYNDYYTRNTTHVGKYDGEYLLLPEPPAQPLHTYFQYTLPDSTVVFGYVDHLGSSGSYFYTFWGATWHHDAVHATGDAYYHTYNMVAHATATATVCP
jgi:type II secretory pathway pseudopilin PulG